MGMGGGPSEVEALIATQGPSIAGGGLDDRARSELAANGATDVEATVVVGDLRLSTFVLKEALRPALYARFLVGFTEAVRGLVRSSGGWFDKFTGDGFVAFWIDPAADSPPTAAVPGFCQAVVPAAETLIHRLRRNSRNFPSGVGLSLGLDSGPCELVRIGSSLTLVGSPIVGATRMATAARAGETLANVYLGGAFERAPAALAPLGVDLVRVNVTTKEYPGGQEAFRLVFRPSPVEAGAETPTGPSPAPAG